MFPLSRRWKNTCCMLRINYFHRNITLHTHSDLMNYGLSSNLIDEEVEIVLRFV